MYTYLGHHCLCIRTVSIIAVINIMRHILCQTEGPSLEIIKCVPLIKMFDMLNKVFANRLIHVVSICRIVISFRYHHQSDQSTTHDREEDLRRSRRTISRRGLTRHCVRLFGCRKIVHHGVRLYLAPNVPHQRTRRRRKRRRRRRRKILVNININIVLVVQ